MKEIKIPGSANITELILFFSSLHSGKIKINNVSQDSVSENIINILRNFAIEISNCEDGSLLVQGKNIRDWAQPKNVIDVGFSFSTLSYLVNILSHRQTNIFITGDDDFVQMDLTELKYISKNNLLFKRDSRLPLLLVGNYRLESDNFNVVNDAVKKYSLLFNALILNRSLIITEYAIGEEYLEHIFNYYGLEIKENLFEERSNRNGNVVICKELMFTGKHRTILPKDFTVPVDIRETFYTVFLALILNKDEFFIANISCNEFNDDIFKVLLDNGVDLKLKNQRILNGIKVVDLHYKNSNLKPFSLSRERLAKIGDLYQFIVMLNVIRKNRIKIFTSGEFKNSTGYGKFKTVLKTFGIVFEDSRDYFSIDENQNLANKPDNLDKLGSVKIKNNGELPLALYLSNFVLKRNISFGGNMNDLQYLFPNIFAVLRQFGVGF